jgi:hypothetical protein
VNRGNCELKRLICLGNYDVKGGQSLRVIGKEGWEMFIMKPNIISWNVRGLNDYEKRTRIIGFLREWKANILCLQETKMEIITREVDCS